MKTIPTINIINQESKLNDLMFTYLGNCESEGSTVNTDILNGLRYLSKGLDGMSDTYVTEDELEGLECLIQDHVNTVGDRDDFWFNILRQIENRKEILEIVNQ